MQHIQQLRKGLPLLDWPRRLSHVCCFTKIQLAGTSEERNNDEFCRRHSFVMTSPSSSTDRKTCTSVDLASTSRSTDIKCVDVCQRCITNYEKVASVLSWRNKYISPLSVSLFISHVSTDGGVLQQFYSTQLQCRTLSTSSTQHSRNFSSTRNSTVDQKHTDHQPDAKSTDSSVMSGSSAPGAKGSKPMPQPPDPETCCESGCVNCVWIRYVQELMEHSPDDKEQVKKVLDLIEDYNVKMFVKMELEL